MIEMIIPDGKKEEAEALLKEQPVLTFWNEEITDERTLMKILLTLEDTEGVLDTLEKSFSKVKDFRIVLMAVEASIPRPEEKEEKVKNEEKEKSKIGRISREELYSEISDATLLTRVYIGMIFFSSIIAAVGILRTNIAVIIGAMIIAPMLGPNVALSLATTLGDLSLARKSLITNSAGILTAFIVSTIMGFLIPIDPQISEIIVRARLGLGDIALAISVGSAGALAYTSGISSTLIGVMVAVALLPPLVTFGLLIGAGQIATAWEAFLLFMTNFIGVNLAGVITFLIQGIRPLSWWEADRAKKSTTIAITLWVILLVVLIFITRVNY
jgi:uncharacterized hydrophobic protein (TIGR00341 family)